MAEDTPLATRRLYRLLPTTTGRNRKVTELSEVELLQLLELADEDGGILAIYRCVYRT